MSALVVGIRLGLVRLGFVLGRALPMRRAVLFATAHADRIGGNLAYLRAELRRSHPEIPAVVLAHRARSGWGGRFEGAVQALRAGWALARSRVVIVDDYFFPIYAIDPRPGTTIIQTWHASGAFKTFGYSVGDRAFGADAALRDRVRIHANYDVCLIGSQASTPAFAEAFGQPPDRFVSRLGIPRTDLFFGEAAERASASVRRRYGLTDGRRLILYAPTFRGDRVTDARHGVSLDLGRLSRELGGTHRLILRLHPFVRGGVEIGPELAGFVVDASDHSDVNELMLVSDLLVTDYSSAIFEFSLLERPMAFFAPDLAEYERERGLYVDYRSWVPGPIFEDTDALARWIREGQFDGAAVRAFREAAFEVADGRASRRVIEEVVVPALA
ncbi:MAG TPA: CDP-glycerol glycerophosphotransferase family protein [Candidatus Limnocylindria bacterium]|nr:CDP-glycerol glycerophosphotransferase family protein [Candidatus Limnocylindria bacterium]